MDSSANFNPLNIAQQRAIEVLDGPVLVVAGAGTGKTRVIEERVLALLKRGAPAERILLLTFTRRAAKEMLERAAERHEAASKVDGGTFHAFAYRMISQYHQQLKLPRRPLIIDEDDAENAIAAVAERLSLNIKEDRLPSKQFTRTLFSASVNRRLPLGAVVQELAPDFIHKVEDLKRIRQNYARYKLDRAYVDYDDLLVLLDLLLKQPDLRRQVARRYSYVMVDEYQDTNALQASITLNLAGDHGNVMVVGDDAQSIYAFRGATHGNILAFPEQFDACTLIPLEENYRSTQEILDTGNALLQGMAQRFDKALVAAAGDRGAKPRLRVFASPDEEARWLADQMLEALGKDELNHYAVLYRNAFIGIILQAELIRRKIPFEVYGGQRITETAHVKDVLAYLRVISDPLDELAWMRLLQLLPGIGPAKSTGLYSAFTSPQGGLIDPGGGEDPIERGVQVAEQLPYTTSYREALIELLTCLQYCRQKHTPVKIYDGVLSHYTSILNDRYDNARNRRDDLEYLRAVVANYRSLNSLLSDLTLDPIAGKK